MFLGIGALSVPTVGVFGSAQGGAGVALGVIAAPIAWPYIVVGAAVGCAVGYGIPKCVEVHRKRKQRKRFREDLVGRENKFSLTMMAEVETVRQEIEAVVQDASVDRKDLQEVNIALNDVFRLLDTYFLRKTDE